MTSSNFTSTQMPNKFLTQRLYAERASATHKNYLEQILNNPQVQEAYNNVDVETFTNVSAQLKIIEDQWHIYGYGLYTIFNQETGDFIGFAGFHATTIDQDQTIDVLSDKSRNELEIYGLLMPDYWRKGYAAEIGKELIRLAFTHLPHTSIIACIEPKNEASLGLIKKFNFQVERTVHYNNRTHILYRLKK